MKKVLVFTAIFICSTVFSQKKYKDFKSLHYFLRHTAYVINKPSDTYLQVKRNDRYEDITYAEVFEQLNAISAYLYDNGLRKGDKPALYYLQNKSYLHQFHH